jgi:DNA repair exonuclease SbcCD ATPase subunit
MEITPEQKAQIETWAGQRDAILLEISNLRTEREKLETMNRNLATSCGMIEEKFNRLIGRLTELDKVEKDYNDITSNELHNTLIVKARLESEVTSLEKVIKALSPQKESLQKDITALTDIYNTMNNRAGVLEKVVAHVTTTSEKNVAVFDELVSKVSKSMQELIAVNKKAVSETDMVVKELPKVFFDVQRASLQKHKING